MSTTNEYTRAAWSVSWLAASSARQTVLLAVAYLNDQGKPATERDVQDLTRLSPSRTSLLLMGLAQTGCAERRKDGWWVMRAPGVRLHA